MRESIRATYDSRETGPVFHVTYTVNDHTVTFRERVPDPFVNGRVTVSWVDVLRAALRGRRVVVGIVIGGDLDRIDDVLELDANTLVPGSTRQATFRSHINERLGAFDPDSSEEAGDVPR